jgi:HK97 family phage major capsid protein
MNFTEMSIDELQTKVIEMREQIEKSEDIEELRSFNADLATLTEEIENRKAIEAEKAEIRSAVAEGAGSVITEVVVEEKKMSNEEIRNSKEYIDAYANYIRTEDDTECRALLTENGSGSLPVPELVYDVVKTAWDREGIMSRVRKAYVKGNLKVGFEISASGAVKHTEGQAVDEETLVLGTVNLIPSAIKKWISVSDEALDIAAGGENFLRYIYDELAYQIAKKAADELIASIQACGTVSTTTCPGVPKVTAASATLGTVADAIAHLSDEAANPVIIMNKLTWGTFKSLQAAGNYGYDPFEGLPVLFNNNITAYSAATTGVTYMIVGDLDQGALANFPAGEEIRFKFDEMTLATSDLVRVIGREYVAVGVVAPNAFVKVTK